MILTFGIYPGSGGRGGSLGFSVFFGLSRFRFFFFSFSFGFVTMLELNGAFGLSSVGRTREMGDFGVTGVTGVVVLLIGDS